MIDTDGNGVLDKDEMASFCKLYDIDSNFVDLAFKLFDHDGDGCLSFDEFVEFLETTQRLDQNPRIFYRKLFDAMDVDKSGALDADELVEFCRLMRNPISREEAIEVIRAMDFRSVGAIIYDDLIHWLQDMGG
jgi:Ca2+-binding EF-hand superfamily protein